MAADGGERESLPEDWSYGVCADGRVFFIDDRSRSTSWLHPRTGEPVNSGHMIRSDLPRGWEEGFTMEGASFFIDHNQRATSFRHPESGEISPENAEYILRDGDGSVMSPQQMNQRPYSMVSEGSTAVTTSTAEPRPPAKASKSVGKVYSFGKRDQSIKRNPSVPVLVRGWLYKQDSSGMKLWKRRWFLLSDYCLFYYKDSREEAVLGSIPLPSYIISVTGPEDRINRRYSFKAVHAGMRAYIQQDSLRDHPSMRTYYFSADTQEDMNGWIRVMNQAALVQNAPDSRRELVDMEWPPSPENDLIHPFTDCAKPEEAQERSVCAQPRRSSAEEAPHRDAADKAQRRDASERGGKERKMGGKHQGLLEKERSRDPSTREDTRDPSTREGTRQSTRESYVAHQNTLNSNGGRSTTSLLSNGRPSAFTDFSKSYRPQVSQTPQPQIIERNGTLPPSFRVSAGPYEQNGTDTYTRRFPAAANPEQQVQRKSVMGQVEQWVKVQKGEGKSAGAELPLPRSERYQTLPKTSRQHSGASPPPGRNLPSDYKYAQDRVSHLKMSDQERQATKEGMVWQLYEWQQRQQFKHGSPTGQIYMGPLEERSRAKSLLDVPRSVSVPPSPSDIPPPAPPKFFPPRRPHTPADRLTVRPEEGPANVPFIGSPQKTRVHGVKSSAPADRRSMPSMGYMTHTVSAPSLHGQSADDTYLQLKKELEYLDLKVTGRESYKERSTKPVKIAESDVDVKLSVLCEQDRILQDLEDKIRALKDNKDKLETVLEVLHRQMDQYKDQPQHTEKISYQQRLLQEDLVQIRAEMSKVSTDMENSWNEYLRLETDVIQLRQWLQEQMKRSPSSQDRTQLQKDLWRIEDVTAGLSSNKLNFKMLVESFKNPERKTVPLVPSTFVPSGTTAFTSVRSKSASPHNPPSLVKPTLEVGLYPQPYFQGRSHSQPQLLQKPEPRLPSPTRAPSPPKFEESAPPRPPLPDMYSPEDADLSPDIPPPPALPPPPRESSVIRHTSVRGLKRQSDERKRDRELGANGDYRVELRTYVSDPELANLADANTSTSDFQSSDPGYQTLPTRGLSGSTSRLAQSSSSVASYVTLRKGTTTNCSKDRPRSAFDRLYSGDNQRGKISAEEQLERMKRHQKALVRERKRTLSQGEKSAVTGRPPSRPLSADLSSWKREQDFDFQLLEKAARDVEDREKEDQEWVHARVIHVSELDLEPEDYDLDISKELSTPEKVEIPERYVDLDPQEPLSKEEQEARYRRVEKIKNILTRSSVHNLQPAALPEEAAPSDLDLQLQEQQRMITISYALASEASQRSKQVAAGPLVSGCVSHQLPAPLLHSRMYYTIV
ncbi:pleckstrin homology domain-containing family A member 7 isoform X3 [Phyllobates terribilis]|uniref:pleckstrin homology domain-containing family A member 7 isoform X3 n=1 Tax=Phyllobates terribilis TaxID=111132 RepID=UPI003CCAD393